MQTFMWSFKHVVLWKKFEQELHLDGLNCLALELCVKNGGGEL